MTALIGRLLGSIGSFLSLLALLITVEPKSGLTGWEIAGLTTACLLIALYTVLDVGSYLKNRPRRYRRGGRQRQRIRSFMQHWIQAGGRVAIFSNDLTWVDSSRIKELLQAKAKSDELTIVTPRPTQVTVELAKAGAQGNSLLCAWIHTEVAVYDCELWTDGFGSRDWPAARRPSYYRSLLRRASSCVRTGRRPLGDSWTRWTPVELTCPLVSVPLL